MTPAQLTALHRFNHATGIAYSQLAKNRLKMSEEAARAICKRALREAALAFQAATNADLPAPINRLNPLQEETWTQTK